MGRLKGLVFLILQMLASSAWAKIGYFWHITDIHYDVNYTINGDSRRMCWRPEHGGVSSLRRPAGKYGDYSCDSPWRLVESAARAMKSLHGDNIEFVLWTGDSIAHVNDDYLSSEKVLMVMQNLTDLLRHTFSSQFVFPVLGNHDFYPQNQLPPRRHPMYKKVADMWRHWLPTEAIDSFEKGGYYTIEQKGRRFRLVALNTNLYYRANHQTIRGGRGFRKVTTTKRGRPWEDGAANEESSAAPDEEEDDEDDPAGQWRWLEGVLEKSMRNRETVYLVGHVPPGVEERSGNAKEPLGSFKERVNRRYLNLVRKYSHVIVGQFFGHHHSDSFRVIYSEDGLPISWMFIAPSVTPWRTPAGANNPGIRLYKFDTNTGQVLDYVQYYLDLDAANHLDTAEWKVEYNLTSFYGLSNVSAASLHELAETFLMGNTPTASVEPTPPPQEEVKKSEGATESLDVPLPIVSPMLGVDLFERYYRANSVGYKQGSAAWGTCSASCRRGHYCSITQLDYSDYQECMDTPVEVVEPSHSKSQPFKAYMFLPLILPLIYCVFF
ncbi:acid sphingomyelinase-like phosphodiesterase 3b [Ischnura elegans]|uniref:acid sphingomyelinase-like phosphodiesterase 3b n=1 Tax=Ischnura elegans TaxID=197161 RepID=UPI001ED89EE9|nr:acid sphingomyelinase-like phosphodiesterase 3b [Ischnura elegans]